MTAKIILENGKSFIGKAFGDKKNVAGEIVFTTGMVGYQEVITDASYAGQIVVMTFPLIGNYGINLEDSTSDKVGAKAIILREKCDYPSNFRNEMNLEDFLKEKGIVGIEGIDTRALTQEIRDSGCMKAVVALDDLSDNEIKLAMDSVDNKEAVLCATTDKIYTINDNGTTDVAYIDLGAKGEEIKALQKRNCKITVFPANVKAEEVEKINPAFIFFSNGPGNPLDIPFAVDCAKVLIEKYPVCGVSLGHQVIALAMGCKVQKLFFGHHGSNQPVKEISSGKVYITSQNHNYVVTDCPKDVEITFINVNDSTCAGIKHKILPVMSVQFYPDTSPGELDAEYLFDRFLKEVR